MPFTHRPHVAALDMGGAAETNLGRDNEDYFYSRIRYVCIEVVDKDTLLTTGDGKKALPIPPEVNGMDLVYVHALNLTPSAVGIPTFQLRRDRGGAQVDMLSTKLTIDATEYQSSTAAVPAVIDTTKDDVLTADFILVDDDVSGNTTKGVYVTLGFRFP